MDDPVDQHAAIAAAERMQTEWFRARAAHLGGESWNEGPLDWVDGPDGVNVMFPQAIDLSPLLHGVEHAREKGRTLVGAWLSAETDPSRLADAGFERGWAPWWMSAPLDAVEPHTDPRVHVGVRPRDFRDEHAHDGYDRLLELARAEPERAFYATVRVDGVLAGHAWAYVDGAVAGIYDLDVWPPFRRRGLGAALLHAVADAAREAGARTAVLSTSPQGAIIYRAQGFTRVGMGSTWWLPLT